MFFRKKNKEDKKVTRILYASDFHGSEAFFRKFLSAALQYNANVLITGGDLTGKAMIPIVHQGNGHYVGHLFGRKEESSTPEELEQFKQTINNVGFYPIVLEKDEAEELEADSIKMGKRFEKEMCNRIRQWLELFAELIAPKGIPLYFLPGNDDLFSIDDVIAEFEDANVHNPDGRHFWIDEHHELVGLSNANITPWRCNRDIEEVELTKRLDDIVGMLEHPERAVMALHVPPYDSGLDVCPELDENLQIVHRGGQVLMKPVGSTAVREMIERVQPLLTLHGHIHEAPGHTRIGQTLAINAGSEYAEGILKAAIINLERDRVKGHVLISG
jgi:Icc-related predicted phosphoesterase